MKTRFILPNIQERNFLDENAYDIFEPTLNFEIDGRDVFMSVGLGDGIDKIVAFHFIESALRITQRMIVDFGKNPDFKVYSYWFLGTGYGFRLNMRGNSLQINLKVDSNFGPVKGNLLIQDMKYLGEITIES